MKFLKYTTLILKQKQETMYIHMMATSRLLMHSLKKLAPND